MQRNLEGRCALFRLLQVYEPGEDPVKAMAGVILHPRGGYRTRR